LSNGTRKLSRFEVTITRRFQLKIIVLFAIIFGAFSFPVEVYATVSVGGHQLPTTATATATRLDDRLSRFFSGRCCDTKAAAAPADADRDGFVAQRLEAQFLLLVAGRFAFHHCTLHIPRSADPRRRLAWSTNTPFYQRQPPRGTTRQTVSSRQPGYGPVERKPVRTKVQQNENMCPIRSKEAFVLTGFRSDGPTPAAEPLRLRLHTSGIHCQLTSLRQARCPPSVAC